MSLSIENAKRMLLALPDYAIDKVIWKYNGSQALSQSLPDASGGVTVTIPHGLAFKTFPKLVFSPDGFATERFASASSPKFFDTVSGLWLDRYGVEVAADETNAYIFLTNFQDNDPLAYKLILLAPEEESMVTTVGNPTTPANDPDRFLLNLDRNYQKIYLTTPTAYQTIASGGSASYTIDHNLGYVPTALAYAERQNGKIQELSYQMSLITGSYLGNLQAYAYLTTTQLVVNVANNNGSDMTIRIHPRIYLDD